MSKTHYFLFAAVVVGLVIAVVLEKRPSLEKIHQKIIADYDKVAHLSGAQFENLNRDELVVFDVREEDEYQVSHIDGAVLVEPGISPQEFMRLHGDQLAGKTAVFYCSVGRRSSALVSQLEQAVPQLDNAYNLVGGLFQWHNEKRDLVDDYEDHTNAIHPYNRYWGQLIKDKDKIQFEAE
ncbi:rhodanese-like domain-containing protein [bacterium SCSIO 12696]|nr:rhodanese-like domain-containing protein [bacterium SCSIO 12696]